jgi:hypothetical protein
VVVCRRKPLAIRAGTNNPNQANKK